MTLIWLIPLCIDMQKLENLSYSSGWNKKSAYVYDVTCFTRWPACIGSCPAMLPRRIGCRTITANIRTIILFIAAGLFYSVYLLFILEINYPLCRECYCSRIISPQFKGNYFLFCNLLTKVNTFEPHILNDSGNKSPELQYPYTFPFATRKSRTI
jgi:hypothetical protein